MTDRTFTDAELDELRARPKKVTNPGARWVAKPGHRQRRYDVAAPDDDTRRFLLYQRQNAHDPLDFSCGLALVSRGGRPLTLVRYNGPSHRHGAIRYRCHIHKTTAEAISLGRPDSHAEATNRFATLEGAMSCLLDDCRIDGVSAKPDAPGLFR